MPIIDITFCEVPHDDSAHIHELLHSILQNVRTLMLGQQDLDKAIARIQTKLGTLSDDVDTFISDFKAKLGTIPNPPDFTAELTQLQAISDKLDTVTTEVTGADPGSAAPAPTS